jgi:hypothetical protein
MLRNWPHMNFGTSVLLKTYETNVSTNTAFPSFILTSKDTLLMSMELWHLLTALLSTRKDTYRCGQDDVHLTIQDDTHNHTVSTRSCHKFCYKYNVT